MLVGVPRTGKARRRLACRHLSARHHGRSRHARAHRGCRRGRGLRHRRHRPAPARHHAERSALRALAHESHGPGVSRHSHGLPRRRTHVQRGLREQRHHGARTRWHSRFLRPALHQSRERAHRARQPAPGRGESHRADARGAVRSISTATRRRTSTRRASTSSAGRWAASSAAPTWARRSPVANIKSVSLFAAGCGIMETLRQSPGYSPVLNNGLAAAGFPPGTSIYWEFVHAAQATVEAGDGCNYAANWIAKPTLMQMIQGTAGNRHASDRPGGTQLLDAAPGESAGLADHHGDARERGPVRVASRASRKADTARSRFRAPAPQTACVLRRSPQRSSLRSWDPAALQITNRQLRRYSRHSKLRQYSIRRRAAFGPPFFSPTLF